MGLYGARCHVAAIHGRARVEGEEATTLALSPSARPSLAAGGRNAVLRTVRLDTIDQRSQVGVALRRLREELLSDLGGDVTAAQRVLIEEAARHA